MSRTNIIVQASSPFHAARELHLLLLSTVTVDPDTYLGIGPSEAVHRPVQCLMWQATPFAKMSPRPIWLAKFRNALSQRVHFAIWVPSADDASKDPNDRSSQSKGTLINVVGTPMTGYAHEVKKNYICTEASDLERLVRIGFADLADGTQESSEHRSVTEQLEAVAMQIPPPSTSENFLAPVNNVSDFRCLPT